MSSVPPAGPRRLVAAPLEAKAVREDSAHL